MGALSAVLRGVGGGGLTFWCAGCNEAHTVWVGDGPGPRWSWNGDVERPVFGPSVLCTWRGFTPAGRAAWEEWIDSGRPQPAPQFEASDMVCHSFVGCNGAQPGQIVYLSDCTHALAGQTIDLPRKWEGEAP